MYFVITSTGKIYKNLDRFTFDYISTYGTNCGGVVFGGYMSQLKKTIELYNNMFNTAAYL